MNKPKISILRDAYAIENGQPLSCVYSGWIARGTTPQECYQKLMDHFEQIRRLIREGHKNACNPRGLA